MLKFIKGHVATIGGIEIYPVISFLIFFLFFLGLIVFAVKISKEYVNSMSHLPLENDEVSESQQPIKNQ